MSKTFDRKLGQTRWLIYLLAIAAFPACTAKETGLSQNNTQSVAKVVALGIDQSGSMKDYRQPDTNFVADVCWSVAKTGGVVVVYGIGNSTDKSGLRCYIKKVPLLDKGLVLTRQAEMKQKIEKVKADNGRLIRDFLEKVQEEIIDPISDTLHPVLNTDINGFLQKVDILLEEPANNALRRYVFCFSDGVQSINDKDTGAKHTFKTSVPFTLFLCGWKTGNPCTTMDIEKLEDARGFIDYLEQTNSITN